MTLLPASTKNSLVVLAIQALHAPSYQAADYRRIAARLWDKLQGAPAAKGPRIVVE